MIKKDIMAITKSARKSIRQSARRAKGNLAYRDNIKKLTKKLRDLVNQKKTKEAKDLLPQIYKILDKSAKVGVIKKNTDSRTKSRLTKLANKSA